MLVMTPISMISACAMKPVSNARTMAQAQMTTTRASMAALSSGTRGSASAGPTDGATGSPSAVAPYSTFRSLFVGRLLRPRATAARPRVVFEQHRRRSGFGAKGVDERGEGVGEAFPFARREPVDETEDLLLSDRRRALQHGAAVLGEIEDQAAAVARVALAQHQAGLHQAADDDRDGTLVGARALGQIVERERRRLSELAENEELRA